MRRTIVAAAVAALVLGGCNASAQTLDTSNEQAFLKSVREMTAAWLNGKTAEEIIAIAEKTMVKPAAPGQWAKP